MRKIVFAATLLASVGAAAQTPPGSRVVLSDKYARPATIDVYYAEATPLAPAPIGSAALAAEFKRLCLDTGFDPAQLAGAAAQSPFGLRPVTLRNLPSRGVPAFDMDGWYGPAASARIWRNDPAMVRKLPFFVTDSGVIITGPQKPPAPQCNLDVASTDLADWDATVAALNAAIGTPGKAKRGKKWAQAEWTATVAGAPAIVAIRVDDLNKPAQSAHIGLVPSTKAN